MEFLTGTAGCHAWTRVNIKPVLGRFPRFAVPRGGWRTKVALTHSISMVRGRRDQGWEPPRSVTGT